MILPPIKELLVYMEACSPAQEWVHQVMEEGKASTWEELWNLCPSRNWLLWFIDWFDIDLEAYRSAARESWLPPPKIRQVEGANIIRKYFPWSDIEPLLVEFYESVKTDMERDL